jgi:hypothetical protein
MILENAVENHFTAKPPRAQRTYSKIKIHPFGETIDHLSFIQNLDFPKCPNGVWRLCAFAVEVLIPTAVFRMMSVHRVPPYV